MVSRRTCPRWSTRYWPIFTKSSSINPRDVMAGVPTRKPLGFIALLTTSIQFGDHVVCYSLRFCGAPQLLGSNLGYGWIYRINHPWLKLLSVRAMFFFTLITLQSLEAKSGSNLPPPLHFLSNLPRSMESTCSDVSLRIGPWGVA